MLYAFSLVLVLSTFCSPILRFSTNLETATLNFHHDSECVCVCFKIVLILSRADSHPPHFSFDEIFLTSCILGIWKRAKSEQLKFSTQNNFPHKNFPNFSIFRIFHTKIYCQKCYYFPNLNYFPNFPIFHTKTKHKFSIFQNFPKFSAQNNFPHKNFPNFSEFSTQTIFQIFQTKKQNTNFPH